MDYSCRAGLPEGSIVLDKYRIGKLVVEGKQQQPEQEQLLSPQMGVFYETLQTRVRDKLQHLPRRPSLAKWLWILDAALLTAALLSSVFVSLSSAPLWFLILLHITYPHLSTLVE